MASSDGLAVQLSRRTVVKVVFGKVNMLSTKRYVHSHHKDDQRVQTPRRHLAAAETQDRNIREKRPDGIIPGETAVGLVGAFKSPGSNWASTSLE